MNTYDKDHKLAKLIIAIIVTMLITAAQLSGLPASLILNGVAVFVWFFGVNPLGYVIESIFKHEHKHSKL